MEDEKTQLTIKMGGNRLMEFLVVNCDCKIGKVRDSHLGGNPPFLAFFARHGEVVFVD